MLLGKLELNESQTINFGIDVFGTSQQPSSIRFIIEGAEFDIVCRCKQVDGDLEVIIPKLKGILESKEYSTRLEVVIGDKLFVPLRESVEFNPLVEFGVKKKDIKRAESASIKVNAKLHESSAEDRRYAERRVTVNFNAVSEDRRKADRRSAVKVNAVSSGKRNSLQENISKMSNKYEIRTIKGFNVLCKDDKYYGFVSEQNIVESKIGYHNLAELVDSLSN